MLYIICGTIGLVSGLIIVFFISSARKAINERRRKSRKDAAENIKRKMEFSKLIIGVYAVACIAWIQQDYVLAFKYQQPINTEVTIALTTTLVASILGYYGKSSFEKANRNKHNLDENGVPFEFFEKEE